MMQKALKGKTKTQKTSANDSEPKAKNQESPTATYMKESEIFALYNEDTSNIIQ